MRNLFIKNKQNKILKVSSICMCEECRKRGMPELYLEDMNGQYADCLKLSDLFDGEYQISKSFDDLYEDGSKK